MSEQAALVGRPEDRAAAELARPPDVVQERRREQQVGPQALVELRRLAADRGDPDRVLEQPAGVRVVAVGGRRQRAHGRARARVQRPLDRGAQPGVRHLRGEELEEALELVGVATQRRRQRGGVGVLGRLERAHLELQAVAEALDSSQDAHGVSFDEAPVEQVDVIPDPGADPSARVDQLEREIGRPAARAQPLLPRDRVHALDRPVLLQLGDRGHRSAV